MKKLTLFEIIDRSNIIHNHKYDYSLSIYNGYHKNIIIICPFHGEFEKRPSDHINNKQGCIKCTNKYSPSNNEFILKCNIVHNNKYDYSLTNYKNAKSKITIVCLKHGDFVQKANNHLNGQGCPKCIKNIKLDTDTFIKRSVEIHKNKYKYSKVIYKNITTSVTIICPIHGDFNQLPSNHLIGKGCSVCKSSKGELQIKEWLDENKIIYHQQHKFEKCRYKNPLFFDFYLPEHNICIEYDGEQHIKSKKHFGGILGLEKIKKRDDIKNQYCFNEKITLFRISFSENIIDKLNNFWYNYKNITHLSCL